MVLLVCVAKHRTEAQAIQTTFTLHGTINCDTGTMELFPTVDTAYYRYYHRILKARIIGGKFSFSDSISYPGAFKLILRPIYASGVFYVETGVQTVICNVDSIRKSPIVENASMKELNNEFNPSFHSSVESMNSYFKVTDSLRKIYGNDIPDNLHSVLDSLLEGFKRMSRLILTTYIRGHPNSYVALWSLIRSFEQEGFSQDLIPTYLCFSEDMRNTYPGKVFNDRLAAARVLAVGSKFPSIELQTMKEKTTDVMGFEGNKYTLVDFWYSHCGPCLGQFDSYKKIYSIYKKTGLQIIGVSTDSEANRESWRSVIKRYGLLWPQYLDLNGKVSSALSIVVFPSNFLVDETGIIIKKNITPVELERFLKSKSL